MRKRRSLFLVGIFILGILFTFSLGNSLFDSEAHPIVGFRSTHGSVTLSIYQNQDLALVEDERVLELLRGLYEMPVQGVSDYLIPSSFHLEFPEAEGGAVSLEELRFLGRPLRTDKMLTDLLGQEIEVYAEGGLGTYRGRLLSISDGILLEDSSGQVHVIRDATRFSLPAPAFNEPTMLWRLRSTVQGPQVIDFRYLTTNIDWDVEYSAVIDEATNMMSFDSWVTIYNNAGLEFTLPKVKLVSANLNRATFFEPTFRGSPAADEVSAQAGSGVSASQAFEYYEYSIPNPTTIHSGEETLMGFLSYSDVPVEQRYVYEPQVADGVQIRYMFVNEGDDAVPLPAGLVRLYMNDEAEERVLLIGEDRIPHTPVDERADLTAGSAFDLLGERVLMNQERGPERTFIDSYQISLTNRKNQPVGISVIEHLPGDWEISSSTEEYVKLDSRRVEFNVTLAPDETRLIEYTVEYHY